MIAMRLILKPKLKNCSDPPHARYRKGRFWRSLGDVGSQRRALWNCNSGCTIKNRCSYWFVDILKNQEKYSWSNISTSFVNICKGPELLLSLINFRIQNLLGFLFFTEVLFFNASYRRITIETAINFCYLVRTTVLIFWYLSYVLREHLNYVLDGIKGIKSVLGLEVHALYALRRSMKTRFWCRLTDEFNNNYHQSVGKKRINTRPFWFTWKSEIK